MSQTSQKSKADESSMNGAMEKWVYSFAAGSSDGSAALRNLLGGKGANLAEMCNLGLPVPPGFTITTDLCTHFYDNDETYPDTLDAQVESALAAIEKDVGTLFGDPDNPLLVSVLCPETRLGARGRVYRGERWQRMNDERRGAARHVACTDSEVLLDPPL